MDSRGRRSGDSPTQQRPCVSSGKGRGCLYDCHSTARVHAAGPRRFLKERKEITEKFAAEQDALLREAQEKHSRELQLLQERHQRHVLSLTAELEAVRRAEQEELRASMEGEQRALAQAREAELQAGHAAALRALEARHSSHLDSLESRHRSEVQALREQHRRALEQLSAELEKQRQHKDASCPAVPTGERGQELLPADGGVTAQTEADPGAAGVALLYPALPAGQQVRRAQGGSPCGGRRGAWRCGRGRVLGENMSQRLVRPGNSRLCKAASSIVSSARGPRTVHPRQLPLVQGAALHKLLPQVHADRVSRCPVPCYLAGAGRSVL